MNATSPSRVRLVGPLMLFAVALGGCGVPVDGSPQLVDATDVPYRLLDPADPAGPPPSGNPQQGVGSSPSAQLRGHVGFVDSDGRLRLRRRAVSPGSQVAVAQQLLHTLSDGPTDAEQALGLGSAIPAGTGLRVDRVVSGVTVIDLTEMTTLPTPERVLASVAQIVFTATSVPGVSGVQLLRNGQPVDAPVADGSLTSAVLTRADYRSLLATTS